MKGVIKIEFILGVVLFAIIIFYIATQINTAFTSINVDTKLDMLKSESVSVLTVLSTDNDRGLAYSKNVLSLDEIEEWNNTKVNGMCDELDIFDLGGYRLNVYKEGEEGPVLFCGYVGLSPIRTIVTRNVKFADSGGNDAGIGNMTMEMW